MEYDLESLKAINSKYHSRYSVKKEDVIKANEYVELIEKSRKKYPCVGDMVIFTSKYGDYYDRAHIETITDDGQVYICEQPYVPFVHKHKKGTGIVCNTSGGAWEFIPIRSMTYVGKHLKKFCDWGSCGPRRDGTIEFEATVNVWEYTELNQFISSEGIPLTTKNFNRMKIRYWPEIDSDESQYTGKGCAWNDDLELQAWLRTYRAEIFDGGYRCFFAWYWKEETHDVSPIEFYNLNLPVDTIKCHGQILLCKREYDEDKHIVHTYCVFHYDEESDLMIGTLQVPPLPADTPANVRALYEINQKKVAPIDLGFCKIKH